MESKWTRQVGKPSMLLLIFEPQSSRCVFASDIANQEEPHLQNEGSAQQIAFYESGIFYIAYASSVQHVALYQLHRYTGITDYTRYTGYTVTPITPCQRISVPAYQRDSETAYQRNSVSGYQHVSVTAYQRTSVSAYQRVSMTAYRVPAHQRITLQACNLSRAECNSVPASNQVWTGSATTLIFSSKRRLCCSQMFLHA